MFRGIFMQYVFRTQFVFHLFFSGLGGSLYFTNYSFLYIFPCFSYYCVDVDPAFLW